MSSLPLFVRSIRRTAAFISASVHTKSISRGSRRMLCFASGIRANYTKTYRTKQWNERGEKQKRNLQRLQLRHEIVSTPFSYPSVWFPFPYVGDTPSNTWR